MFIAMFIDVQLDIDIGLSAQANARKYFTKKKTAATKVVKTVQSHEQAMKSAEKRAKQAMRDVNTIARIVKQRKVFDNESLLRKSTVQRRHQRHT